MLLKTSDDHKILYKVIDVKEPDVVIEENFDLIDSYSFAGLNNLKSVKFTGVVKKVSSNAFHDCPSLEKVIYSNDDVDEDRKAYSLLSPSFKCSKKNKPIFMPIDVNSLYGKSFFINDYQRGYRWGKEEVESFVKDIYDSFDKSNKSNSEIDYYLQPLVVCSYKKCHFTKKISDLSVKCNEDLDSFEVIDGQQRLTTTFLLLGALGVSNPYSIVYKNVRKVDESFIEQARNILKTNIGKCFNKVENKNEFLKYIENKVKFIWYEITDLNVDARVLFRDFNSGKTPLTNSELFRAFLFNRNNFIKNTVTDIDKTNQAKELNSISLEWDMIEQGLKNDDFWYFLSNSSYESKNRIDYILDLYASQQDKYNEKLDEKKDRYSFNVFVKHFLDLKNKNGMNEYKAMTTIWNNHIKDIYDRLLSWYMDSETYNFVGYLIATEMTGNEWEDSFVPNNAKTILKISREKNHDEFLKEIKKLISNIFKDTKFTELKYKDAETKQALLLLNIWETIRNGNSHLRFPYKLFKNSYMDKEKEKKIVWNIEHVNAHQISKDIIKNCTKAVEDTTIIDKAEAIKERICEQISFLLDELDNNDSFYHPFMNLLDANDLTVLRNFKNNTVSNDKLKTSWGNICNIINDQLDEEDSAINNISNLALLDEKTNKGYGNSFFKEKRKIIIERDKTSAYIPICTKNIFLKYYGTTELNWGTVDMVKIKEDLIKTCLEYFGIEEK